MGEWDFVLKQRWVNDQNNGSNNKGMHACIIKWENDREYRWMKKMNVWKEVIFM